MSRYKDDPSIVPPIVASIVFLLFLVIRIAASIRFEQQVDGHLAQAADANSIVLAEERLGIAQAKLDSLGICSANEQDCYTSILWRTPDEDVRFWRDNLTAAHEELQVLVAAGGVDNLTESNQLIKLRETLTSDYGGSTAVIVPPGISVYPHNAAFGWSLFASFTLLVILWWRFWWWWA